MPGSPPFRPKGGESVRSRQEEEREAWPSTTQLRCAASPPRCLPGPPLSGVSAYSSTRTGKLISSTSIGVFMVLEMPLATVLMPSLLGRAPRPPLIVS